MTTKTKATPYRVPPFLLVFDIIPILYIQNINVLANYDMKECHFGGTLFLFTTKSKIYAIIRKIFQEYLKSMRKIQIFLYMYL